MEIIGVIIAGIIIGLLGKFVAPSTRDNIPIWLDHFVRHRWCHHRLATSTSCSAATGAPGSTGLAGSSRLSLPRSW